MGVRQAAMSVRNLICGRVLQVPIGIVLYDYDIKLDTDGVYGLPALDAKSS